MTTPRSHHEAIQAAPAVLAAAAGVLALYGARVLAVLRKGGRK